MRKRQFISSECFEWVWQRLRDYECLILVLHGDAPDNQRRNREEKCVIKLQKKVQRHRTPGPRVLNRQINTLVWVPYKIINFILCAI